MPDYSSLRLLRDRASMREIGAAAAARTAGSSGTLSAIPVDAARSFAGAMADALTAEKQLDATRVRRKLGWRPQAPSVVEEIERGSYADAIRCRGDEQNTAPL